MAAFLEERGRNVIPRWRDFRSTVELGELSASAAGDGQPKPNHDMSSLLADWHKHKTVSFAGDLISAALVAGNLTVAREASEFVVTLPDGVSSSLRALAQRVIHPSSTGSTTTLTHVDLRIIKGFRPSPEISDLRKRLIRYPSNAILWVDLAYFFAVRGATPKAERAIRIALNLAPTNRFVLRSAARFFIHIDRVDIAHDIIRNAPGYRSDPWLVAAEIAVAMSADRTPWATKEGFALLGDSNLSVHHLSELSSAVGTLEFQNGRSNRAKKFLRRSLIRATDNSLAQAQWISRNMPGLSTDFSAPLSQIARPYEANAGDAFVRGDWQRSVAASLQWLGDQPFSSRPAAMAAYLTAVIFEDFAKAEEIARFGLIANPNDHGLHISLAYCYASTRRGDNAIAELAMIDRSTADSWVHAAIDANHGLVAFRQGRPEEGRRYYLEAVRKAALLSEKRTHVSALIHWATEEANVQNGFAERLLSEAREISKAVSDPDIPFLLVRLTRAVDVSKKLRR